MRRPVVVVALAAVVVAGTAGTALLREHAHSHRASTRSSTTGTAAPTSHAVIGKDGTTAPIYSYAAAVRETAWVGIGIDQDGDGVDDRVAADIIRPAEPAAAHRRIPVIMDTSGYYKTLGRGNQMQVKTYDAHGVPVQFPLFLDNYFVPRGYAVVLVDLAGTNRSTGCTDYGGPSELRSSTRVIDWLNGRAPAYTSPLGSTRTYAGWASGSVGMIGKSWDGQNAIETAVTGIKGLDAVVPEPGITSDWTQFADRTGSNSYIPTTAAYTLGNHDLENTRAAKSSACQALLHKVKAGEPTDGDFTQEWSSRDWASRASRASRVRAAVLMTQGQNDTNVYPSNLEPFWSNLPKSLPKKLWLSEVGHVDPFDFRRAVWVDTLHRWFDRFVYKIHNGVENGPQLSVERAPDQWVNYPSFPAAGARVVRVYASGAAALGDRKAAGGAMPVPTKKQTLELTSPPLAAPIRISGQARVELSVSSSAAANVKTEVYVYDLGPTTTRGYSGRSGSDRGEPGILNPRITKSCWGESRPGDSACFYDTPPDVITVKRQFIGWGLRDLRHRSSVSTVQSVQAGRVYPLPVPSYPMDRIIPAGHRLALLIYAYPPPHATASIHLTGTWLDLPVVGGRIAFQPA